MTTLTLARYVKQDGISKRLNDLLGKRAPQFITSVVSAVNASPKLAQCKPESVVSAALTAASMDLPVNSNLGFAYLVPYNDSCQFQMGYKGFIQLAQRSGFYQTINATDIRQGEIAEYDRLTGEINFKFLPLEERDEAPIIGYAAFFRLLNGFEKTLYMTTAELETHGRKYSKTFKNGPWSQNFDAMAKKTVLKLLISKFGPLSTQLEEALREDQVVDGEYSDNPNGGRPQIEIMDAELGDSEDKEDTNE